MHAIITVDDFLTRYNDDSWCLVWTAPTEWDEDDFDPDEGKPGNAIDVEMVIDYRLLDGKRALLRVMTPSIEDVARVQAHLRHLLEQNRAEQLRRVRNLSHGDFAGQEG